MTLEEAIQISKQPYTLQCGHSSSDIRDDYYRTWCVKCGASIKNQPRPALFEEALAIIHKHSEAKVKARKVLIDILKKDIDKFQETNPTGTIDEFYNFIITTK